MSGSELVVEVLLATYNGERFLREQIRSILEQTYEGLRVTARDDGSSDGTEAILEEFARLEPQRFRVVRDGVRSGGAKWNFVRLMEQSTAEYVCLADQDDVWKRDKVAKSMELMRKLEEKNGGGGRPLLVFTDLAVVDDLLQEKNASFWAHQKIVPEKIHRFRRLLMQNVVTGCTALMNRPLVELALTMPADSYMHDWWIALMASGFGDAAYLPEATVLYRQHGANVVGAVEHGRPNLVPRWRYHEKRREQWEQGAKQAEAMLRVHGSSLPADKVAVLREVMVCEHSPSRWVRVFTMVRGGFFQVGLRPTLAILWYLFDMEAEKRVLRASIAQAPPTEVLEGSARTSPTKILAAAVLYRRSAAQSESLLTLERILSEAPELRDFFEVMIFDNSPYEQGRPGGVAGEYWWHPENPGLARCYNEALGRAEAGGAEWLMLLDQDTTLTEEYLREVLEGTAAWREQEGVVAMVPRLVEGGVVCSPAYPPRLGPARPIDTGVSGRVEGRLRAFNSGAVVRVRAVRAAGGFPEEFPLDYLDHATFTELQRGGGRMAVLRSELAHQLSSNDERRADAEFVRRQEGVLDAEYRFYRRYGSMRERISRRWRLLRAVLGRLVRRKSGGQTWRMLKAAVRP